MRALVLGLLLLGACKDTTSVKVAWKAPVVGAHVITAHTKTALGVTDTSHRDLEVLAVGDGATKVNVRYDFKDGTESYVVALAAGALTVTAPDGSAVAVATANEVADDVRDEMGPPSGLMKVLLRRPWTTTSVNLSGDDLAAFDAEQASVRLEKVQESEARFAIDLVHEIGGGSLSATVFVWLEVTVDIRRGHVVKLERKTDLPSGPIVVTDIYTFVDP